MATFRCLQSGQTVTFIHQHDIDSMKGHQGYVRIDEVVEEVESKPLEFTQPPKKLGRPKKVVENV
jgi:hypothetical protein